MSLNEIWNDTYQILGIIGTFMGVFGLPSVAVLYNRALKRQIEFSPALAYAYTYFNNFIAPLHDRLVSGEMPNVDGVPIDRLFIRMPQTLTDVSGDRFKAVQRELEQRSAQVQEIIVETRSGRRTLLVRSRADERIAFDIPRILSTMEQIIAEHLGEPRNRATDRWARVERREIQNFCRQIRRLIKQHGYQQRIRVFNCEPIELTPDVDDLETGPEAGWMGRLWKRAFASFRAEG